MAYRSSGGQSTVSRHRSVTRAGAARGRPADVAGRSGVAVRPFTSVSMRCWIRSTTVATLTGTDVRDGSGRVVVDPSAPFPPGAVPVAGVPAGLETAVFPVSVVCDAGAC